MNFQPLLNFIGAIARQFHKPQRNTWGLISKDPPVTSFLQNLETAIESGWQKNEVFVLGLIVKIKAGIQVIESDIAAANIWITSHAPAIVSDIQGVLSIFQSLTAAGTLTITPTMQAAVNDANEAITALNAYTASIKSGSGTGAALVAGYTAVKQATAAHSGAALALTGA